MRKNELIAALNTIDGDPYVYFGSDTSAPYVRPGFESNISTGLLDADGDESVLFTSVTTTNKLDDRPVEKMVTITLPASDAQAILDSNSSASVVSVLDEL